VRWRCAAAALVVMAASPPAASGTDRLLAALKTAPDSQAAGDLENRLQTAWHDQATPSVQLLSDHAAQSAASGKVNDALADADAALVLQPELADLWRRRAEVKYALGDDRGALADLAQALTREPRLIPAWADLSRFAEAHHDAKRALSAWQKLLELDPKTEGGGKRLERLQHLLHGEPI
jgi:tetratricopeptide (TPR) repeat protein